MRTVGFQYADLSMQLPKGSAQSNSITSCVADLLTFCIQLGILLRLHAGAPDSLELVRLQR